MRLTDLVLDIAEIPGDGISMPARQIAEASLLDWLTCGLAGIDEPLATKMRDFAAAEGGLETATLFGGGKVPPRMAALVNGATSHALDFDDTHFDHVGHLSVAIYPAALATGEEAGASARQVADAFAVGAEAAIRIGRALGAVHYNAGFHQTATAGAFGATVAAGRLRGLDRPRMRAALGLCATRASGLKSQFGTMGKPYNAGLAAANGVECSMLAKLGLTSADDGLAGPQGFLATHSQDAVLMEAFSGDIPPAHFRLADNKYKFHACCHGTHAMIEALLPLARQGIDPAAIRSFSMSTNPRWLKVCDIKAPRTGLETKFSYVWLAGMVLHGIATENDRNYSDQIASDQRLADFSRKISVSGDAALTDLQVKGAVTLVSGEVIAVFFDLAEPRPIDEVRMRLTEKARVLLGGDAERIIAAVANLDSLSASELAECCKPG